MQAVRILPQAHLFVCANRRPPDSALGVGCADEGEELYVALKREVARRGSIASVWVTKTHCLGICPTHGATVALYPRQAMWGGAEPSDAPWLLDAATAQGGNVRGRG